MAAQQAYNIGRDATLNIVANGVPLSPTLLTNFESSQEVTELESNPLNGPPIFQNRYKGWKGSFDVDRSDGTLDSFFSKSEADFYAGADAAQISILQTVVDAAVGASGQSRQYLYVGVVMTLTDAGAFKADDKVVQKVSFRASLRNAL